MKTFREYVEKKDNTLLESFIFVGRMTEAGDNDIMEAGEARSAIEFVQMVAADIKQAVQHTQELLTSFHPSSLEDLKQKLTAKLHDMLPEFNAHYEKVKSMAGQSKTEVVQTEAFGWLWQGFMWLVKKMLTPLVSLALKSIMKTIEIFILPYEYGKAMGDEHGVIGATGGFAAGLGYLALTVLLLPYLLTLGAPVAVGGFAGMWSLYWLTMEWFKRNILEPALRYSEG